MRLFAASDLRAGSQMIAAKWEIVGLKGRYCPDCVRSLRDFRLQRYSIVPMCRECLHEFLTNGDMKRVEKMIGGKNESEQSEG